MVNLSTKPRIYISLPQVHEAYCRFIFSTPDNQPEIIVSRAHDIGKLIHANVSVSDIPVRRPLLEGVVTFILPVNNQNCHGISSHFLKISAWGRQKIQDGIAYEFDKWVKRRFEIGYEKKFTQKEIVEAILRGLNVRNNSINFDAVKKNDYRNRRKIEEKRFMDLLVSDS